MKECWLEFKPLGIIWKEQENPSRQPNKIATLFSHFFSSYYVVSEVFHSSYGLQSAKVINALAVININFVKSPDILY